MGWTPMQVRQTSLPDFAASVAAWNAMQAGDDPLSRPSPGADAVASKLRTALGGRAR